VNGLRLHHRVSFQQTMPLLETQLLPLSGFQRYLDEHQRHSTDPRLARLSQLSPSLMQDLMRFERHGQQTELLEVMAACVRHARALAIYLQYGSSVLPLTMFPLARLAHCPVPMRECFDTNLSQLVVLRVEPAALSVPGDPEAGMVAPRHLYQPLGPVVWDFAMRGSREQLLPEIGGVAAYRIAAGTLLRDMPMSGSVRAAVHRLQRRSANLREIANWSGLNRGTASRLLNALYLQGALIVSRTAPGASNDSLFGAITRF
jgi:hypothetical protein